jgi:choline/glycine/proline betaine transport protein
MLTRLHDRLGLRTGPHIFFISALVIIAFTVAMAAFPAQVQGAFGLVAGFLRYDAGWFYTAGASLMLVFALALAASRYGRVKIGDDDAEPEYSGIAWFGMIFAAGVGAVLMFWGVAEPINHYANPPLYGTEPESDTAAMQALSIANFHFGLHMWAILSVPGLAFGYFTYKRKLPPRVSSAFQPLLGDGIHGPWGKTIDIISIVATVFGLAVSVGLGALQINSGMNYVLGVPVAGWIQAVIIAVITAAGLASVVSGMDKGVKRLSYANIIMAVALMVYVLMWGASMDTMRGVVESAGAYLSNLPALSFFNDTFGSGEWSGDWTVFYWAWTVTWSPFVGLFVAKISRGRTVRQFVLACLGLPTAFVVVWMGIYGLNAVRIDRAAGTAGSLTQAIVTEGNVEAALFQFLQSFPLYLPVAVFALLIITVFFVTSMDSGALVMDSMANGHEDEAPKRQRVFWTVAVGAVCTAILTTSGENGLNALQEVIIVIGFPVMIVMLMQSALLLQALREDAGSARPIRTRQWKRVLPLEEYHRRAQDEEHDIEEYVIRPEYEVGTEPEHDTHQPNTWHWQQSRGERALLHIGLTGGIASGKSLVAAELTALGAHVIDADGLAREVVAPGSEGLEEIREAFGSGVLLESGELDRSGLAGIVFGNATAREKLNEIIHPRVRSEIERLVREVGPRSVVVVDLPLLLETDTMGDFDLVLTVEAPAETRVARLLHGHGISAQEAWERIDAQANDAERREIADAVITNDAGRSDLAEAVREFWADKVQPVLDQHDAVQEVGIGD